MHSEFGSSFSIRINIASASSAHTWRAAQSGRIFRPIDVVVVSAEWLNSNSTKPAGGKGIENVQHFQTICAQPMPTKTTLTKCKVVATQWLMMDPSHSRWNKTMIFPKQVECIWQINCRLILWKIVHGNRHIPTWELYRMCENESFAMSVKIINIDLPLKQRWEILILI